MKWLKDLFGKASSAVPLTAAQEEALAAWQKRPPRICRVRTSGTRYIVVDVESSGLNMVRDSLISIGAVAVCEGVIDANDAFEVVLRQDQVSSHENILIHGIGGSAQREGVEPADALLAFLDYVGRAPLVAYHAEFDQAMIGRALREFLGRTSICRGSTWPGSCLNSSRADRWSGGARRVAAALRHREHPAAQRRVRRVCHRPSCC